MPYHTDDTIVAIASAAGGAARGIVRVTGPGVVDCVSPRFAANESIRIADVIYPSAIAGKWQCDEFRQPLPATLYLWPTNRSFTRQPLAEIHTLGSPPVLDAVVQSLRQSGARLAEPGEFTLRAFLAGRIDLTQAEAVLGVIDAQGERQLAGALEQLAGGLSTPLDRLRSALLDVLAHLEAGLDFVDEDIEFITSDELLRQLAHASALVQELLCRMEQRAIAGDEIPVALIGPPNAGKSSLLNALAGDEAAIVSPQAGTTRDYVTRRVVCEGLACLLVDTAGVESAADAASIAAHAQQMMGAQSEKAALKLLCLDASRPPDGLPRRDLTNQEDDDSTLIVWTKCDLVDEKRVAEFATNPQPGDFGSIAEVFTSAKTGQGLGELRAAIARAIDARREESSGVVATTALRCRASLASTAQSLSRACDLVRQRHGEELVAAELRMALNELGMVLGAVYTDDILDRIFSRFCIGK